MVRQKLGGKNQIGLPARRAAVKFLKEILREKKSLDELFAMSSKTGPLQSLSAQDRALVRHICATVLRRYGQLKSRLNNYLEKPLPRKSGDAWEILLTGAAQILYMNVPAHAAIDLSVRLAAYDRNAKHFKGLINAVLRRIAENEDSTETDFLINTPNWLLQSWKNNYTAAEINQIATQHLQPPTLDITCKNNPALWAEKLNAEHLPSGSLRLGIKNKKIGKIEDLPGFKEGEWWVQDIAATLPVKLLGEVKGKYVLDLCAAPGGKSLQLSNFGAHVTSIDQSENRLKLLRENFKRTGLKAEIVCNDALSYKPHTSPDAIILDAPCSATGTLRRHPDLPVLKNEKSLSSHLELQKKLLTHAAKLLKPGGDLIYCTCSLERAEGEEQINFFLDNTPNFSVNSVEQNEVWDLHDGITIGGFLRTLPFYYGDKGGMDGFFIARLKKSTS